MTSKTDNNGSSSILNMMPGYETSSNMSNAAVAVIGTCAKVNEVLRSPGQFFKQAALGVREGIASPRAGASDQNSSRAPSQDVSLVSWITQLFTEGIASITVVALEFILSHAKGSDLDPQDQEFKKQALEALQKAKASGSVTEAMSEVKNTLDKYHIIVAGNNVNSKKYSNTAINQQRSAVESDQDGQNPHLTLYRAQEDWDKLRNQHSWLQNLAHNDPTTLPDSYPSAQAPSLNRERMQQLESATNAEIDRIWHQGIHSTAMQVLHNLLGHTHELEIYNQFLDKPDIRKAYLDYIAPSSFKRFFYEIGFDTICTLIAPFKETLYQIINKLRDLLKSEKDLLPLVEEKIKELADYYGRIELARVRFLDSNRPGEAGTFSRYLEESLRLFNAPELNTSFTKEDLIRIFGEYIVENFIPRPSFNFLGRHIPIISTFSEWIVHSIRKKIVRDVLKETHVIEKILQKGTDSITHGQFALKQLMVEKLTQIIEMIRRSRTPNSSSAILQNQSTLVSQLRPAIQAHSDQLLRFIKIESCNDNKKNLAQLGNESLAHQFVNTIKAIADGELQMEEASLDAVLRDATSEVTETTLLAFFEDKEIQIEQHIQTLLKMAQKEFTYVPPDLKQAVARAQREACRSLDDTITELQNSLSNSAVDAALENHLTNKTVQRHSAIKNYVQREKQHLQQFCRDLNEMTKALLNDVIFDYNKKNGAQYVNLMKTMLNDIASHVQNYLEHIKKKSVSSEFQECYRDVKGDLHNTYALVINWTNQLRMGCEAMAQQIEKLEADEKNISRANECQSTLRQFSSETNYSTSQQLCSNLLAQCPSLLQPKLTEKLNRLLASWSAYENAEQHLQAFDHLQALKNRGEYLKTNISEWTTIENNLNNLKRLIQQYYGLKKNQQFPTEGDVGSERERLATQIEQLYTQIMNHADKNFKYHVAPHMLSDNIEELYYRFYPSPFQRSMIFSQINRVKAARTEQLLAIQQQIQQHVFTQSHNPIDRTQFEGQKAQIWTEIQGEMRDIVAFFQNYKNQIRGDIGNTLIQLRNILQFDKGHYKNASLKLTQLSEENLEVKGYISVGETQIYNMLSDAILPAIAPLITKDTQTMIAALGKPFHYEQLLLRLLFLDIAKRHTSAHR